MIGKFEGNILHVYGQGAWHDDVAIAGSRAALTRLKLNLQHALQEDNNDSSRSFFVNDGEGYSVRIVVVPDAELDNMAVPYYEDMAEEKDPAKKIPR